MISRQHQVNRQMFKPDQLLALKTKPFFFSTFHSFGGYLNAQIDVKLFTTSRTLNHIHSGWLWHSAVAKYLNTVFTLYSSFSSPHLYRKQADASTLETTFQVFTHSTLVKEKLSRIISKSQSRSICYGKQSAVISPRLNLHIHKLKRDFLLSYSMKSSNLILDGLIARTYKLLQTYTSSSPFAPTVLTMSQ